MASVMEFGFEKDLPSTETMVSPGRSPAAMAGVVATPLQCSSDETV